jgi:D-serine deaminase-like pyridoxal phosphate-dependent protein
MAPQIFERQIDAGCWALTAATPSQLAVYRAFGVNRIFYANQLVDRAALAWIAAELERDPSFEIFTLVDSVDCVLEMASELTRQGLNRQIDVLVEVGHPGGRTGCRDASEALAVAKAVGEEPGLRLAGVEAFEGTLPDESAVAAFLETFRSVVDTLALAGHLKATPNPIVSAGGSAYFDLVLEEFKRLKLPHARCVLRSGAYVTHDSGFYADHSPSGRGSELPNGPHLRSALELWAVVQSRPEPELVILGAGKRDVPIDLGPPRLVRTWNEDRGLAECESKATRMIGVSDQHLHLEVPATMTLQVGDLAACSISHPCTAFDKWQIIPVVSPDLTIIDAVKTFF